MLAVALLSVVLGDGHFLLNSTKEASATSLRWAQLEGKRSFAKDCEEKTKMAKIIRYFIDLLLAKTLEGFNKNKQRNYP